MRKGNRVERCEKTFMVKKTFIRFFCVYIFNLYRKSSQIKKHQKEVSNQLCFALGKSPKRITLLERGELF